MSPARKRVTSIFVAMAAIGALVAGCGSDNKTVTKNSPREITVVGTGKVQGEPDTLQATIGAQASGDDVSSAIAAVNAAADKVITAVKNAGVEAADIQTEQMSITPNNTNPPPGQASQVSGYQATNTVRVTIRDLSKASEILDQAIAAGGNATRLDGVSFSINDDSKLMAGARERAFDDAKAKAKQYAKLSNGSLGDVVSIDEQVNGGGQQPMARTMAAMPPVEPGQQTVSVSVTVKWRLK